MIPDGFYSIANNDEVFLLQKRFDIYVDDYVSLDAISNMMHEIQVTLMYVNDRLPSNLEFIFDKLSNLD